VRIPARTAWSAAALILVAGTAGCSAGTSTTPSVTPGAVASASAGATAATGSATVPTSPASSSAAADVQRLTLTVKGSTVTGDTGTVDVKLGRPVELTVTSDVADEVHVHGVDIGKDVPAGGTVVIDFTQTAPGRFEVELEQRKRVLTRLQVS